MVAAGIFHDPIDTLRMRIRRAREDDAVALSQMMSAAISARLASWPERISAGAMRQSLRDLLARQMDHAPLVLELRQEGAVSGWLSVSRSEADPTQGVLTYWIGEAYHGLGLMREAAPPAVAAIFQAMELGCIRAAVQPDNAASIAVLEATGMRFRERGRIWCASRDRYEECLWFAMDRPQDVAFTTNYGKDACHADVAESVDASDFNWSARGEILGAEPLKVGER